ILTFTAPIYQYHSEQISLLEDSIEVKNFQLTKAPDSLRKYILKYPWKPAKEYVFRFNEGAFTDIYNNKSRIYTKRFTLDTEDNYGNIAIRLTVPDTSGTKNYIIQWMGEKENIYHQDIIRKDTLLNYLTYPTGKYRIRIVYDE